MALSMARPAAVGFNLLDDDAAVLCLSALDPSTRLHVAALVSKRWHRLVHSPDLLRQGVTVSTHAAPHLERLQALRRWLRRHAGSLHSLSIETAGPSGNTAELRALQAELGRCFAVACSGGTLRTLHLGWLRSTQLRLGPELAVLGPAGCPSLRELSLSAGKGTLQLACPLQRLSAVQRLKLQGTCRFDSLVQLPPSITHLVLKRFEVEGAGGRAGLPTQLVALTALRSLDVRQLGIYLPSDGYAVLSRLPALRCLSRTYIHCWPNVLEELTGLERLELNNVHVGREDEGALRLVRTLSSLTGLTSLGITGYGPKTAGPAGALADCTRLATLWEDTYSCPALGPDAWPAGLLAVHTRWGAVLSAGCQWEECIGQDLQMLSISRGWVQAWGSSYLVPEATDQPSWQAFWAWAARAPSLRLVELHGYGDGRSLEMKLAMRVHSLKRLRPALKIVTNIAFANQQRFEERAAALLASNGL